MNKYLFYGAPIVLVGLFAASIGAKGGFDFSLTNEGNKLVMQGGSVTNTITAALIKGSSQNVSFSASGVPNGVSGAFSPIVCKPNCQTSLVFTASASSTPGNYPIAVVGVYKSLTRTTNFTLTINPTFGDIRIKRVGSDDTMATAPSTSAWVDAKVSTSTNPSDFTSLNTGSHTAYVTDAADYSETVGTCIYPVGGTECAITNFSTIPSCNGTACSVLVDVFKDQVAKVAFKYTSTTLSSPPPAPTSILTLSPNSETAGVRVILSGNFFTATGNNISFSPVNNPTAVASANNAPTSPDGTLYFGVPSFIWPGFGSGRIWVAPGDYNFKVTNAMGVSATAVFTVKPCSPPPTSTNPAITLLSPVSGPLGTAVTICAHDFTTISFASNQGVEQGVLTVTYPIAYFYGAGNPLNGTYLFGVPSSIWSSVTGTQVPVTAGDYLFTVSDNATNKVSPPVTFTVTP